MTPRADRLGTRIVSITFADYLGMEQDSAAHFQVKQVPVGVLGQATNAMLSKTSAASAMVVNTSGGLARATIDTTRRASDLAFNTVKAVTRFGLGISSKAMKTVGLPTHHIDWIGTAALGGVGFGHSILSRSLKGSSDVIRIWQQTLGDPFALELLTSITSLLLQMMVDTGKQINIIELFKYVRAWTILQEQTKELWNEEFIYSSVVQMKNKLYRWKLVKQTFGDSEEIYFPSDPSKLLPILRHFAKFANGCYSERGLALIRGEIPVRKAKSERAFYATYCGIEERDIIYMDSVDSKTDVFQSTYIPRYCISLDHSQNTVVLAFRGTMSVRDVLVDLVGDTLAIKLGNDPFEYVMHRGFLQVAMKITQANHQSKLYDRVDDLLKKYPSYSLSITGHSLGAAVASIVGVLWADPATCRTRKGVLQPNTAVRVYAFAGPSVMSVELGEKCKELIITTIIGWDWLARISHAGVQEVRDAAVHLMNICTKLNITVDELVSESEFSVAEKADIRRSITKGHLPGRIYPAGRILWIHHTPEDPTSYYMYKVKDRSKVFGQLLFCDKMLEHHQPTTYDDILDQIKFK